MGQYRESGLRGANQIATSVGSAKGWGLRKIDVSLKPGPIRRKIWSVPPMEAVLPADNIWLAEKAIYWPSERPSGFRDPLDNFFEITPCGSAELAIKSPPPR